MKNFEELEQRYQLLFNDYQANNIDEATFMAELDQLQFQDEWGRYWMIGAQTGGWHYYDGQAWHQADPREADKLPIMDEHGVYWQRGSKSGEWYYYQPDTGQWIQPENPTPLAEMPGANAVLAEPPEAVGSQGELFQDDEGRYWAAGAKSGQWYFYDDNGWHPAQEFHAPGFQGQPTFAQPNPPTQVYPNFPPAGGGEFSGVTYLPQQQPMGQIPQVYVQPPFSQQPNPPIQVYVISPGQDMSGRPTEVTGQPVVQQPAQPVVQPAQPPVEPSQPHPMSTQDVRPRQPLPSSSSSVETPKEQEVPPRRPLVDADESHKSDLGTVSLKDEKDSPPAPPAEPGAYYFDGKKWTQAASHTVSIESTAPAVSKTKESSVAQIIERDDEAEVVEVEVITVIEPDWEEEKPIAKTPQFQKTVSPPPPDWTTPPIPSGVPMHEEVKPRQVSRPVQVQRGRAEQEIQAQPQARTKPNSPPTMPKTRETTSSSAVVVPTGADPSTIPPRPNRPVSRPMRPASSPAQAQVRQNRARESTLPLEPLPAANVREAPSAISSEITKPLPISRPRSDSDVMRGEIPPRPIVQQSEVQPEQQETTIGTFFQTFSFTTWSAMFGVILLVLACIGIIIGGGMLNLFGPKNIAGLPVATQTLDTSVVPNFTPTKAPTLVPTKSLATPTPSKLVSFNSKTLDLGMEYPDGWQVKEDTDVVIFSPSDEGLDAKSFINSAMRVSRSTEKTTVSDLLAATLAQFPLDAQTLNEGTISIASHTWTSVQIRFDDKNSGKQDVASLAVTAKDGQGYSLVAVAPANEWNSMRELFQVMLNSFHFATTDESVTAVPTSSEPPILSSETMTITVTSESTKDSTVTPSSATMQTTPTALAKTTPKTPSTPVITSTPTLSATPTPKISPTPTATPKPLVYTIQSGDTLLQIADDFGVSVDLLATENGLNKETAVLGIGKELIIPFTKEELDEYNRKHGTPSANVTEISLNITLTPATTKTSDSGNKSGTPEPTAASTESKEPAKLSGRIVYPAFDGSAGTYNLWLADLATGEQVIIAGQASQPAFSRDGGLLAYRSWDIASRGIVFRDFIGGRGGQITHFVEDGLPSWAPDGFSFVFCSRREGDRVARLFRGDQKGQGEQGIPFEGSYVDTLLDGRLVSRGCLVGGVGCGFYVLGSLGGGEVKLGTDQDTAPSASPNGSKIAFMSIGRGSSNWEIWVINTDGSNPLQLTKNGNNDGLPTWSPDGKSIAFVSDQAGVWAIWVMNADGSNQRKLIDMKGSPDGKVLRDVSNSKGWTEERISWAP